MDSTRERLEKETIRRYEEQQRRQAEQQQRSRDNRARQIRDEQRQASLNRQQAALNSFRPSSKPPSPIYNYPAGAGESAPTAPKYRAAQNLGFIAAVLTGLVFYFSPQLRGQFGQVSGEGPAATAIAAGVIAGGITFVIVAMIISIVEWIKNHPILFILTGGAVIYAWVHFHGSP